MSKFGEIVRTLSEKATAGEGQKIMDNKNETVSKPSAPFLMKDLYKQAGDFGGNQKVPAQTKITLDERGLGLRLSTGTQDEEESPTKKKKSCMVKAKAKRTKHTIGTIMQQRNEFQLQLAEEEEAEDDDSKQAVMKENKDPNENPNFAPPFVVDLMTQENGCDQQSVQSPSCSTATFLGGWESGGWTNTPENWVRIFQARSTEGGADFFVDKRALGEVVSSLFRDLTSEFSAAKNCG
jgi:hypothetical protein